MTKKRRGARVVININHCHIQAPARTRVKEARGPKVVISKPSDEEPGLGANFQASGAVRPRRQQVTGTAVEDGTGRQFPGQNPFTDPNTGRWTLDFNGLTAGCGYTLTAKSGGAPDDSVHFTA